MTAVPLNLIVDEPGEAAWNMAVDEALLQLAGAPVLRLYGWSPHAVSLGYFQSAADFEDLPHGTPLVRRLTGGGAIHHGDEITFALVADLDLLPRDVGASYRLVHDAIGRALRAYGVRCARIDTGAAPSARPDARWCFAEPGANDLVTERGKLLGSAQRRVRTPRERVLHHGSIALRRPALTPFVAAIADDVLLENTDAIRRAIAGEIAAVLDLALAPRALSAAERTLAATLRDRRYATPAFVRRS